MRPELEFLYDELGRSPEDWSVRLRLIEAAVAQGDMAEARRLVRTSPDEDRYLPPELQDRIHAMLTSGARQVDREAAYPLEGEDDSP